MTAVACGLRAYIQPVVAILSAYRASLRRYEVLESYEAKRSDQALDRAALPLVRSATVKVQPKAQGKQLL